MVSFTETQTPNSNVDLFELKSLFFPKPNYTVLLLNQNKGGLSSDIWYLKSRIALSTLSDLIPLSIDCFVIELTWMGSLCDHSFNMSM